MNLLTLLWFIVGFFGVTFVVGTYVLTIYLAKRTVKNDASKATILVKNGLETTARKGKLKGKSNRGVNYEYGETTVFVPSSYAEVYHKNRRLLFVSRIGQLITNPFDSDTPLQDTEKENLIYELVSGHIGADSLRALRGKGSLNVLIIAIVAFAIGALGVYGFLSYQDVLSQNNQPQTAQPSLPNPIEVK